MADGEILAPDMEQETAETLNGSEQFVMFDTEDGKRATLAVIADYIVKHGEIDGDTIEDLIEAVENEIGTLANLSTTAKTNIVAAINEVLANQGALSSLSTTAKTTLVAAINELKSGEDDLKEDFDALGLSVVDGAINVTYTV